MKTTTTTRVFAVLAALAFTAPVQADEARGWYGGLNVGQSLATIDDDRIASSLAAEGFAQTQIAKDTRDLGFKAFAGYQFGRHFALEGGYYDLGKFGFTADTLPPGTLSGQAKFRGVNLDAVGILPLTEKISAFGRAGMHYTRTQTAFQGTGAVLVSDPSRKQSGLHYKVGVGLEYAPTPQVGVRAELERYRLDDAVGNTGDVDLASLGLVYRFKPRAAAEPQAAAAAPSASSPLPAPQLPLPPIRRSLTLSTDSQFDFDRAVVRPEGEKALDQFAADLKGSDYDLIVIKGHTDRLGSETHNADLSLRRAEAVKRYLVEAAAIPPAKIDTEGLGEVEARIEPADCGQSLVGERSAELIRCLQADRRVEVEALTSKVLIELR